ncbi:cytochrome c/c1 heme lyase-domain-containing protein [Haematococcus lacustris]
MKHSHSFPFLFSTRLAAALRSAPRNMGNTTSLTPTTSASGPGCSVQASTAPSECPVQPAYRNPAIYNVYGQRINDPNAPASASSPLQSVQNSNLLDPRNNMPLEPNQLPCPGQRKPLSVERVASAIPKGGTDSTWLFPSPQMVFNALRRKGKGDDVTEDDMDGFIAAHNAMNEDTWRKVAVWERLHAEQCSNPTLLRFQGKPHDLSPLARVRSWMSGQTPFDRHDWVVDRCGQEVRYVIDFYFYDDKAGTPEAFEIVARPALDSLEAVVDRVKMNIYVKFAQWGLPCPITGSPGSVGSEAVQPSQH